MEKYKDNIWIMAIGLLILVGVGIGITLEASDVGGFNNRTITKVNVTNVFPVIYRVSVINSAPIDLEPNGTISLNCTGLIYDGNGWDDIVEVNATFYDTSWGDGDTFDNNYRYQNASCNSSCTVIPNSNNNNASCYCLFDVYYYANNGTWGCNMTVSDATGLEDSDNSTVVAINTLVGIEIPQSELDYGDMSVTEMSNYSVINVTNIGNVPLNISVRGWGGTAEYNLSFNDTCMICETGNISNFYQRYTNNLTIAQQSTYANMTNLSNTSTLIPSLRLPVKTDDNNVGNETNSTYWKLYIPSGVSGFCNGTLEFSAVDATG
ncbi:MAG: hypothetical protein U9O94_04755 [Nanoarchaeota archaeon]|nr:hypothetical protein [Nanoarchaeota archaeon]